MSRGPTDRLDWGRPADPGPPPRPLWRDPVRVVIGVACATIPLAAIQPMASGSTPFDGPVIVYALTGAGDGILLVFIAAATAPIVFWRPAAESGHRIILLLPLILGALAVLEFGLVYQAVNFAIADWTARNGSGAPTLACYALGAAAGVLLVGGAILAWRTRALSRDGPHR